jgi:hypothetical protein
MTRRDIDPDQLPERISLFRFPAKLAIRRKDHSVRRRIESMRRSTLASFSRLLTL